jgi:lysine-specific demethylase 3
MLLPVLKEINAEHKVEVENDAEKKEGNPAEPQIHSSELTSDDRQPCSNGRDFAVVDLQRMCTRSSSVLRLNSDQDQSQESLSRKVGSVKCSNGIKSPKVCKRKEVKGCSNNLFLSLFPLELTSKLEISAEEVVSCYELPEILDKYSGCPFCIGMETQSSSSDSHLKEASKTREDGTGNFLYYPTVLDFHQNNLEHFQTHWSKGHPVIVRSVIKSGSSLNWDPVALFCHYLMNRNNKTGNTTDCMDWFEVEIGVKQFFLGSLRGKAETNTCQERLKLEGWLSSSLFKEQFPNHYAEILNILPISHYMDPKRGLLNIAANLPDTVQPPDFGPCLNISYRSGEEYAQPDSVKKLGFETCDMVDILLYVTETPVSTNQICRIRKLMKNIGRVRSKNPAKGRESRFDKGKKRDRLDDYSSSDSESSQHCLGAKCRGSEFEGEERESCNYSCEEESLSNTYGAQWDVFQKQDVSKLLEYIKNHSLELESMDSSKKKVSHPLLEQSYYLDEYHKARLKEEFDVEPWSFDQCVGEAVILPAGCPYQIRKNKSCVNAVLKFLSPEHVSESIKRVKELNQLPQSVKSKANKIEVKKMAIHKISEAVKEIRELTSSDSTGALRLYN